MGFEGKREPDIKKVRRFLPRLLSKRLTPAAQDYAPPRSSLSESRVTVRCSDLLEMSRLTLVLKALGFGLSRLLLFICLLSHFPLFSSQLCMTQELFLLYESQCPLKKVSGQYHGKVSYATLWEFISLHLVYN